MIAGLKTDTLRDALRDALREIDDIINASKAINTIDTFKEK